MTTDQAIPFALLFLVFAFLIRGRLRYDLVAFMALTLALLPGVVPKDEAFSGVGHPATIIIAPVPVVSRGLSNSGVNELVAKRVSRFSQSLQTHIAAMAGIAAPIALAIAIRLQVSPDPFLMAVAVAASCAFLTPIGHRNNTLVMGPGGYRFGDYWRMGLPLEILIVLVSVPVILWVWPFQPCHP